MGAVNHAGPVTGAGWCACASELPHETYWPTFAAVDPKSGSAPAAISTATATMMVAFSSLGCLAQWYGYVPVLSCSSSDDAPGPMTGMFQAPLSGTGWCSV